MILSRATLCVLLLSACGCGGDEPIQSYTVPRQAEPVRKNYRILGGLFPQSAPVWYFKFTGSEEELKKHEADFGRLLASVKMPVGDKPPEFTVPPGWINIGERTTERMGVVNKSDAVLKIGSKESALEVTLNRNEGDLKQNLIRWADQVAADYDPDTIAELSPFPANGVNGLRVDFTGHKNPAAGGGPMMRPR